MHNTSQKPSKISFKQNWSCIIGKILSSYVYDLITDWGHYKDHRRHFELAKRGDKQRTIPSCTKFSLSELKKIYKPLLKCSKRFIPPHNDGMICFYSNIGCSESNVIFKWRKNNNKNKKKAFTRSKRSHLVYFIQSQSERSQNETNRPFFNRLKLFIQLHDHFHLHISSAVQNMSHFIWEVIYLH